MKAFASLALFLLFSVAGNSYAESLRCGIKLVQIGDTKADVIQKCGSPMMTDSYCRKNPRTLVYQSNTLNNQQNYLQQNNQQQANQQQIVVQEACEEVDVMTYNPGYGQFITHLHFIEGELRYMKYGERVN